MKPTRLVDLRVLLEAACSVALALALLMPFFTVSAKSYVPAPIKAVTSISDSIPQEPIADLFVVVAVLALILSVWRILRPPSGLVVMALSLASFVAAGALVAVLQLQWNDATSGWQASAAKFLGAEFSHSFGFWVFLGAAVVGGGLVLTELATRLIRGPASAVDSTLVPAADIQSIAPIVRAPASAAAETAGSGRVAVVESGRSTAVVVALGQTVVLGRDPGCDIRLTDPLVSRRHASIERVSGGWAVHDLGTTNPSRLIGSGGAAVEIGAGVRVPSGQLLVGDALVTLYP
jgi:Inner membrane component of T3SS, cytoplasmic domain